MKYTVLFSDDAEEDVAELLQYLVPVAGERIARRYVDRLIDYCYSFETFPERGGIFRQEAWPAPGGISAKSDRRVPNKG